MSKKEGYGKYSKLTLKGDRALIRRLKKLEDLTKVEQVVRASGEEFIRTSRTLVPVDTGHLRDGIDTKMLSKTSVKIISNAEYSGYVEYGTRYMKAQPYFRPTMKKIFPEFQKQLKKAVEDSR